MPYKDPDRCRERSRERLQTDPKYREKKREKQRRYKARRRERERAANPEKFATREQAQQKREAAQQEREAILAAGMTCLFCGRWFALTSMQPQRKYCSERCGRQGYRDQNPQKRREERRRRRDRLHADPARLAAHREKSRKYEERNREQIAERVRARRASSPAFRAYTLRASKKYKQRLAEIIPAPRNGEPWTPAEDRIVMRDELTVIEVCYMVGRSYSAVAARRFNLRRLL